GNEGEPKRARILCRFSKAAVLTATIERAQAADRGHTRHLPSGPPCARRKRERTTSQGLAFDSWRVYRQNRCCEGSSCGPLPSLAWGSLRRPAAALTRRTKAEPAALPRAAARPVAAPAGRPPAAGRPRAVARAATVLAARVEAREPAREQAE